MLLDDVRAAVKRLGYSVRTADAYVHWIRRFILFHDKRHPKDMGTAEVREFLTHLAVDEEVASSTQNQAQSAVVFLYREVLGHSVPGLDELERAKHVRGLPVVLSRAEVTRVMARLDAVSWLQVSLLYGSGLRLEECQTLRVKDVDFERAQITVRHGKGGRDRVTMLPVSARDRLERHLSGVREQHARDLADGAGWVELPHALGRKAPTEGREWPWQWVFPASRIYVHAETGQRRRHHVHPTTLQRAVRDAARRAGLSKRVHPHVFRHCFATHLLERGAKISEIQKLMGHADVSTTMVYLHVLRDGVSSITSPLDDLPPPEE